ncbi:hypothetical protein [Gemmata massiliana]|nr:hypothetical protein [Gemmata massiliana]
MRPGAVVTAAMWADGERFTANEPWADVYDHSLWVLRTYVLPPEDALCEWWAGMGFSDAIRWAPWSLFERQVASTAPTIPIEPREWDALVEVAGGPARASRAEFMLADVGISLEPYVSSPETERGPVSDSTT